MERLEAGSRAGVFILEKCIGTGAFASVWRARHCLVNLTVAVKVIPKDSIDTPLARTRLTREISIIGRMEHPFIAQLFQISEDDDFYYLAMEYVENGNLLEYVNSNGRLSEDAARRYFSQLVWVLEYLHNEHHIAHRDLKCENILLDRHLNIKVIDFGLSAQFTEKLPHLSTACGSPAYAAPEMIKGQPYTKSADIWSAGILLFAIVAGYLPFDDEHMQRLLHKIVYSDVLYPPFMSPALVDLLDKMICKTPETRIDIDRIKCHPWFSNSEYMTMVQMSGSEISWQTSDGRPAGTAIDSEIVSQMTGFEVDCHDLPQALLAGEENEKTILYKLLARQKLTDKIKDVMEEIVQGPQLLKPLGTASFPKAFKAIERPPSNGGVPGIGLGQATGRGPIPGRRMSRPNPASAAVVASKGGRSHPFAGLTSAQNLVARRLSRPVAVRKPLDQGKESTNSPLM